MIIYEGSEKMKNKLLKKLIKISKRNIYIAISLTALLGVTLTGCGGKKNKETDIATATDAGEIMPDSNTEVVQQVQQPQSDVVYDAEGFVVVSDYVETTGDTVNVRVQPTTDASIYELLAAGEVLKRTGYNDQWTRVFIDNTNLYIYSEYVVETEAPVNTDADGNEDNAEEEERIPKEKTIVIDPGNQSSMNASTEPVGPGSEQTKVGVNSGVIGTAQGTAEYAVNLTYALALKDELEGRGYTVTLTRETNDANITNKGRAELANSTGATAFVRIKMNYSTNDALTGVMAVTMSSSNPYNSELYGESQELATRILQGITVQTEAENHGIYETDGMTAINWSDIPVAVIELGYLSNADDEAKLLDADYQKKVISGMADGIDLYYN